MFQRQRLPMLVSGALLSMATGANAATTYFDNFTPLGASAGPTANEAIPLTLSSPNFSQRSIADRASQQAAGQFDQRVTERERHRDRQRSGAGGTRLVRVGGVAVVMAAEVIVAVTGVAAAHRWVPVLRAAPMTAACKKDGGPADNAGPRPWQRPVRPAADATAARGSPSSSALLPA